MPLGKMPRLRKREGLWECVGWLFVGYGWTEQQAFKEWQAREVGATDDQCRTEGLRGVRLPQEGEPCLK